MLEGTELNDAYAPLMDVQTYGLEVSDSTVQSSTSKKNTPPMIAAQQQFNQVVAAAAAGGTALSMPSNNQHTASQPVNIPFNKQFEQEQKIAVLVNELKKQKAINQQNAYMVSDSQVAQESYIDKLIAKKKDIMRFIQSGLIILFAISLHFLVDFFLKIYLQENNITYGREVTIRVLYPVAVLFLAWNIITLLK